MVLTTDQQRVCTMLKDTITLLCKNGLTFKTKFSIEAVIGVTLDDEHMFHVSMNEIIKSPTPPEESDSPSETSANGYSTPSRKRKKRLKRESDHRNKSESSDGGSGNESGDEESAAKRIDIKGEPDDFEEDSGDIVFVKQEMDENWSQSQSQDYSNFPGTSTQQDQDHNFSSLSELDLTPVTTNNDPSLWATNIPSQQQFTSPMQGGRMQRTATVTGMASHPGMSMMGSPGQAAMSPMAGGDQSMSQVSGETLSRFSCPDCGKSYSSRSHLSRHTKTVHMGIYPHVCQICGKGFVTKDHFDGHVSMHAGKKVYQCSQCDEEFRWKASRDKHIHTAHQII